VVDFYFRCSRAVADLNMIDIDHVVTEITDQLTRHLTEPAGDVDPIRAVSGPTLGRDDSAAAARSAVADAMELLSTVLNATSHDALTLLRARAYAIDRSVDDVAADLLQRRITTDEFRPEDNTG
jgi:hypothetical protein